MKRGVSIIICCYNSANRLSETLKHIALQQCVIYWELIVVDNNSTDNTAQVAIDEWNNLGNPVPIKVVEEGIPGLSTARKKGVEEAQFDYLIFCDDDNWLASNYVNDLFNIFEGDDKIAIVGGNGTPITEVEPPIWFNKFIESYAAFPQAAHSQFMNSVYGAGMGIRKSIYNKIKTSSFLSDRKMGQLSSGGDSELCYQFKFSGYKIWYDEGLKFKHFIPKNRLEWNYLKKLHLGFAKTYVILNLYEKAISDEFKELPSFYWLKKAFYYIGIYLKYWSKHYNEYQKGEGSIYEIHHITWRTIGFDYLKQNFKTVDYYKKIYEMKQSLNGK